MPAFTNTGKGDGKKVPGVEMPSAPNKPARSNPGGMAVGGDQGGVKMGGGHASDKKVPAPEIKGRHVS